MRRLIPLILVGVTLGCRDHTDVAATPDPLEPGDPAVASLATAIGAALDHVVELPEIRDPVHFGSRTFRVSGNVLVRVASGIAAAGIEEAIRDRGWTLVREDPRVCGDDWTTADDWGWPHCWLAGEDPEALYLSVSSARATGPAGYEVVVHPYRNSSVPADHYLTSGILSDGGHLSEYDADRFRSEYTRLQSALSDHPGILNDGGEFHVLIHADGATTHGGRFEGPNFSIPGGNYEGIRGQYRRVHGPYRMSPEKRRWHHMAHDCHRLRKNGNKDGYRDCKDQLDALWTFNREHERRRASKALSDAWDAVAREGGTK